MSIRYSEIGLYDKIISYFQNNNIKITYSNESEKIANGESYYCPTDDSVKIPSKEIACSRLYFLSTVCHEAIHSTMKIVERIPVQTLEGRSYEEMIAETGAFMLLDQFLDVTIKRTKSYRILCLEHITYLSGFSTNIPNLENVFSQIKTEAQEAINVIMKEVQ